MDIWVPTWVLSPVLLLTVTIKDTLNNKWFKQKLEMFNGNQLCRCRHP